MIQEVDLTREVALQKDPLNELQRWARLYQSADIIPADWSRDGNIKRALARIVIVLNLANKKGTDPLILLQNVQFIQGHMCWRSTFMLQLLRMVGWKEFQWEFTGDPQKPEFWKNPDNGCIFSAVNPDSKEREQGTKLTVGTVVAEGWDNRKGNKWKTMTEQLFKYRSAAFFCRTNAPEVLAGFYTTDEVNDFVDENSKKEKKKAIKEAPQEEVEDTYDMYEGQEFEEYDTIGV